MLYELLKKACNLPEDQKRYFSERFEEIVSVIDEELPEDPVERFAKGEHPLYVMQIEAEKKKKKKKGYVPIIHPIPSEIEDPVEDQENDPMSFNSTKPTASNKTKIVASYLSGNVETSLEKVAAIYDPDTADQLLKIVDLIEKFFKIDKDMSYDNMCIFLSPLSRGAKRSPLRPLKLVGLTRDLFRLCRKHDRLKKVMEMEQSALGIEGMQTEPVNSISELDEVQASFRDKLSKIRKRVEKHLAKDDESSVELGQDKSREDQFQTPQDERIANLKKNVEGLKSQGWSKDSFLQIAASLSYSTEEIDGVLEEIF